MADDKTGTSEENLGQRNKVFCVWVCVCVCVCVCEWVCVCEDWYDKNSRDGNLHCNTNVAFTGACLWSFSVEEPLTVFYCVAPLGTRCQQRTGWSTCLQCTLSLICSQLIQGKRTCQVILPAEKTSCESFRPPKEWRIYSCREEGGGFNTSVSVCSQQEGF